MSNLTSPSTPKISTPVAHELPFAPASISPISPYTIEFPYTYAICSFPATPELPFSPASPTPPCTRELELQFETAVEVEIDHNNKILPISKTVETPPPTHTNKNTNSIQPLKLIPKQEPQPPAPQPKASKPNPSFKLRKTNTISPKMIVNPSHMPVGSTAYPKNFAVPAPNTEK